MLYKVLTKVEKKIVNKQIKLRLKNIFNQPLRNHMAVFGPIIIISEYEISFYLYYMALALIPQKSARADPYTINIYCKSSLRMVLK